MQDSSACCYLLAVFSIGLPSFVLIKILQPAFYAREDMRTPMWFSGINAIVNIVLSLILFPIYGVIGLGIATSIAGWVNALLLMVSLYLNGNFRLQTETARNIFLILIASAVMGTVIYMGQSYPGAVLTDSGLLVRLIYVGALIGVSGLVYLALVIFTGAVPRSELRRLLRR